MNMQEIIDRMQKRIDKVQEKTDKKIKMNFTDFNNMSIEIDDKKYDFIIPREMQAFIDGMYFILK